VLSQYFSSALSGLFSGRRCRRLIQRASDNPGAALINQAERRGLKKEKTRVRERDYLFSRELRNILLGFCVINKEKNLKIPREILNLKRFSDFLLLANEDVSSSQKGKRPFLTKTKKTNK
jgi:hypothetical protein